MRAVVSEFPSLVTLPVGDAVAEEEHCVDAGLAPGVQLQRPNPRDVGTKVSGGR